MLPTPDVSGCRATGGVLVHKQHRAALCEVHLNKYKFSQPYVLFPSPGPIWTPPGYVRASLERNRVQF